MIRICAWCGEFLGIVGDAITAPVTITHGICDECAKEALENYYKTVARLRVPEHFPRVPA